MATVVYEDPVRLQDGRYFVKASTSDNKPVYVSINNSIINTQAPWDQSTDIPIVLSDADVANIQKWDSMFMADAVTNSTKWFQREFTEDVITSYYQSALEGSTLETQPSVNSKGRVNVAFFLFNNDITKNFEAGSQCRLLIQFDGLWFLRKSFGPVWKITQVKMRKVAEPVKCLIQDEDSD
jgi:hypothetical protein